MTTDIEQLLAKASGEKDKVIEELHGLAKQCEEKLGIPGDAVIAKYEAEFNHLKSVMETDNENITERFGLGQVIDMAVVENIEDAVGENYGAALLAQSLDQLLYFFGRERHIYVIGHFHNNSIHLKPTVQK